MEANIFDIVWVVGPLVFVHALAYVNGHMKWKNEDRVIEDFDIVAYRDYI